MKAPAPILLLPLTLLTAISAGAIVPPTAAPGTPAAARPLTGNLLAKSVQHAQTDKSDCVLVSDFTVAEGRSEKGVTLTAPQATCTNTQFFADPSLRDQVEVVLTPEVIARLNDLGINDPVAHFKGRTLQVRGKRQQTIYTGFPAFLVYTITVDRLEDIKVTDRAAKPAARPAAQPEPLLAR